MSDAESLSLYAETVVEVLHFLFAPRHFNRGNEVKALLVARAKQATFFGEEEKRERKTGNVVKDQR